MAHDHCRPVEVDGEIVRVRGRGKMTDKDRAALAEVVRAAKRHLAKLAKPCPAYHPSDDLRLHRCMLPPGHAERAQSAVHICTCLHEWPATVPTLLPHHRDRVWRDHFGSYVWWHKTAQRWAVDNGEQKRVISEPLESRGPYVEVDE